MGCLKWTWYWEVGALSDHLTCELGALRGAEEEGAHVGGARSSYGPVQYSSRGYLVLVAVLPAVLDSPSFLTMKLGSASLSLQHEELF